MSIKKADYIAKYGEDAWAVESAKRKKYNKLWREGHPGYKKQYYEDNKQQIAEQTKQYRKKHAEEKKEYLKQYRKNNKEKIAAYRAENKEKISAQQAAWHAANKEKIAARRHAYYIAHKEEICAYNAGRKEIRAAYNASRKNIHREYMAVRRSTPRGRAESLIQAYNLRDKKRGFDITRNINTKWMEENIFSGQKCIYCGESDWRKLGCDRIDNTKGHTPDNVVCSCRKCNENRGDRYSVEEFVEKMKKEKGGA